MSTPRISAIFAMSENRVIGKENKIPWYLPADFKHFKTITLGHPIIMGRKTFESIGKPLANRTNIIITRDKNYKADGCTIVNSLEDALMLATSIDQEEVFIIGGAEIYKQAMDNLDCVYLTIVHANIDGDTFLPELPSGEWKEIEKEVHRRDEKNMYDYSFLTLVKK